MTLRRALTGAAAALVLVLSGCQETATGIFHHLAHQQPTVDRNLANDITIGGVVRWDDRYLVAAGKLWSRAVGTDAQGPGEWGSMTVTFDGRSRSAVMLPLVRWRPAAGGPSLLAGALFVDEERFALLQAAGSRITANAVAWESVPGSAVASGREVIGLFTPGDASVLFAVVAESRAENRTYRLLSAARRSAEAPVFRVELAGLSHPVAAVATDGDGTYWAVSGSDLYAGRLDGGLRKPATAPSPEGSETFRGVIHDGTGTLLLTGSTGTVWRSRDGGVTWPDTEEIRADDQAVPLWGAVAVGGMALIGSDGHGYYTASLDGDLAVARLALTTEAIYHASILRLWMDPVDAGRVFALTASDGLWSASVDAGELPDRWQLE